MNRAFTLIEMLVVLVIIAIILTVAVMSFGDFGRSREQKSQIVQFKSSLQSAQAQAILQPSTLRLAISDRGYRYERYWHEKQKSVWRSLKNDVLSQPDLFETGTKVKVLSKTKAIYFTANGTITPFKISIQFPNKHHYKIEVDSAGGVSVAES